MPDPHIEKKIQVNQFYEEGSVPDFNKSEHFIFVLSGENNAPEKFMELFKEHYKEQYNGKKLVFLHTVGKHWTTYECDYRYEPDTKPTIKKHEIRGDGRCGLHAVAKALQIVSGRQNLVENIRLHGNEYSQFPDSAEANIFTHLGLDEQNLQKKWIDRIEKPVDDQIIIEREGYSLGKRIRNLTDASSQNDWLSSDDIEYILVYTNIRSANDSRICLGSSNEQINMLPASGKEVGSLSANDTDELDKEILRKIFDDKNWKDNKFEGSKASYSLAVKNYLDLNLFNRTDRFEALKMKLKKYEELNYQKMGDKIKVSELDRFNNIPFFYEKEGFLRFITNNHASFDQELKSLIRKTLMYVKIRNMNEGDTKLGLFDLDYIITTTGDDGKIVKKPSSDKFARIKINELIDEFLELYPESQDTTTIDDDKKRKLLKSIGEAFSNAPETIPKTIIKIDRSSAVQQCETKADGGTNSKFNIKKFNSINSTGYDEKKLKELKYIKITDANDQVKVQKVSVDRDEIILQELGSDQKKYGEICCYSEYVKYAEKDKSGVRPEAKDFFSFEPKKYKGFGLKIRFEEKNQELIFEECFNDEIKKNFKEKNGKKILKINGESIKKHLANAERLGIEPEYYINSLFRAQDSDIKLTFDDGDVNLVKDSKKTFEKKGNGSYCASQGDIDIEKKKQEIDKLMILGNKRVTFETQQANSDLQSESRQLGAKDSTYGYGADDVQASSASCMNAKRAIKRIKEALTFQDLSSSRVHFDWWFVNDFSNERATDGACKYSAEDKKSLLIDKEYLNNSLDLAIKYFDQLLKTHQGQEIYGIRLIKIYNYLTILQDNKQNETSSLFVSDKILDDKLEIAIKKLELAIKKRYKNDGGDRGVLDHDGLMKNVNNLIVSEARSKKYHKILKERVMPSSSPRAPGIAGASRSY